MFGILEINSYKLSITPIKFNDIIYWITTPHGLFIEKDKEYLMKLDDNIYKLKLWKQAMWCDLAIFNCDEIISLKIKKLKILKSHNALYNISVKNKQYNLDGFLEKFYYSPYLDINGANRTLFYQINLFDKIEEGMSGSAFYNKDILIGLASSKSDDGMKSFLIPGFFIVKLLNESISNYSPFLPIKLTIQDNKTILFEDYKNIKKGFHIKKFDSLKLNKCCEVYSTELKDNIPIDVYLQLFKKIGDIVRLDDGKCNYNLDVYNINDNLRYPFVSNVSLDVKSSSGVCYQDLWLDRDNSEALYLINNNLKY